MPKMRVAGRWQRKLNIQSYRYFLVLKLSINVSEFEILAYHVPGTVRSYFFSKTLTLGAIDLPYCILPTDYDINIVGSNLY
jgi:hypothetical protein